VVALTPGASLQYSGPGVGSIRLTTLPPIT
jgi:hypothetical protein